MNQLEGRQWLPRHYMERDSEVASWLTRKECCDRLMMPAMGANSSCELDATDLPSLR